MEYNNKEIPIDKKTHDLEQEDIIIENYEAQNKYLQDKNINLLGIAKDTINFVNDIPESSVSLFLEGYAEEAKNFEHIKQKNREKDKKLHSFSYSKIKDFNIDPFIKSNLEVKDFTCTFSKENIYFNKANKDKLIKKNILDEYDEILPNDFLLNDDKNVPDHIKLELINEFKSNLSSVEKIKLLERIKSLNDQYLNGSNIDKNLLNEESKEFDKILNENFTYESKEQEEAIQKEISEQKRRVDNLTEDKFFKYEKPKNSIKTNNDSNFLKKETDFNDLLKMNSIDNNLIDNNFINELSQNNFLSKMKENNSNESEELVDFSDDVFLKKEEFEKNIANKNDELEQLVSKPSISFIYEKAISGKSKEELLNANIFENDEVNDFIKNDGLKTNKIEDIKNNIIFEEEIDLKKNELLIEDVVLDSDIRKQQREDILNKESIEKKIKEEEEILSVDVDIPLSQWDIDNDVFESDENRNFYEESKVISHNQINDSFFIKEKIWNPVFVANEVKNDSNFFDMKQKIDNEFFGDSENITSKKRNLFEQPANNNDDTPNKDNTNLKKDKKSSLLDKLFFKTFKNKYEKEIIDTQNVEDLDEDKQERKSPKFNQEIIEMLEKESKQKSTIETEPTIDMETIIETEPTIESNEY